MSNTGKVKYIFYRNLALNKFDRFYRCFNPNENLCGRGSFVSKFCPIQIKIKEVVFLLFSKIQFFLSQA